jgi:tetratricopeptide (TPR) repeat protein
MTLLSRALALGLADPRERVRAQVELGHALWHCGRRQEACAVLDEARDTANTLGEAGVASLALIYRLMMQETTNEIQEIERACEAAIETFAGLGDERGLALARRLLGLMLNREERWAEGLGELERAMGHAEAAADMQTRRRVAGALLTSLRNSPVPVAAAIDRCERLLASADDNRVMEAKLKRFLAMFRAMAGHSKDALELIEQSSPILDEFRTTEFEDERRFAATAKLLAGDTVGAEREYLARWSYYNGMDSRTVVGAAESALDLAMYYCDEGRWDEAELYAAGVRDLQLTGSLVQHHAATRLAVEGRLAAQRGELVEAARLAKRALELTEARDRPTLIAPLWLALAEVQRAAGRLAEADQAVERALELYLRKGNVAAAARLRDSAP